MGKEHNVESINLWFTDILGILKSSAITAQELEGALERGVSFEMVSPSRALLGSTRAIW
jgi:glutamine synthetase